ncbi:hypothetical protein L6258_00730 [Candidatus Parcubacteria bacterium]|nr:hypothetical protein [Candidatus Parcubacteria bacterium]
MFEILINNYIFREILYRPLLNLLIYIYDAMPLYKDMGIALIIFVVAMRIVLYPLRRQNRISQPERKNLTDEIAQAEEEFRFEAAKLTEAKRQISRKYRKTINFAAADLGIELIYFFLLWFIFTEGLRHLDRSQLYSFVRTPQQPMNLTFFNLFDLLKVSPILNLISAIGLFVALFLHNLLKKSKVTREDYLVLAGAPLAAYFISSQLPAGQEFFFTITETIEIGLIVTEGLKKRSSKKSSYAV